MNSLPGGDITLRDCVLAGIATAAIPVAVAFAFFWFAPWGCDASAWLCLFPLSLLGLAPIAALCLPVAFFLNRRRRHPFPDGWLPVVLVTASASQLLVSGYSLWSLPDHMRRIFFVEALTFPQGLVAGALIGAVFTVSMVLLVNGRKPSV